MKGRNISRKEMQSFKVLETADQLVPISIPLPSAPPECTGGGNPHKLQTRSSQDSAHYASASHLWLSLSTSAFVSKPLSMLMAKPPKLQDTGTAGRCGPLPPILTWAPRVLRSPQSWTTWPKREGLGVGVGEAGAGEPLGSSGAAPCCFWVATTAGSETPVAKASGCHFDRSHS